MDETAIKGVRDHPPLNMIKEVVNCKSPESKDVEVPKMSESSCDPIYPDDLCPFGDEEEDEESVKKPDYDASLNPFGSDDEEEIEDATGAQHCITPMAAPRTSLLHSSPSPVPRNQDKAIRRYNSSSVLEKASRRPDLPPPPPPKPRLSSPFGNRKKAAPKFPLPGTHSSMSNDTLSIESGSIPGTPDAPRRSGHSNNHRNSLSPSGSTPSDDESISTQESVEHLHKHRYIKKKKAPPIPVPKRTIVTGSIQEIQDELCDIGDRLVELQKRNDELEELFRKGGTHRQRRLITEYLAFAQEKCSFARRQEELSYM